MSDGKNKKGRRGMDESDEVCQQHQ
jgi:hypothetical protein